MEDETTNKLKKNELNFKEFLEEDKQGSKLIDESIFDETLEEIDQILFDLEKKIKVVPNISENPNILSELNDVAQKMHVAKNELTKEEGNFFVRNNVLKRIEDIEKNIKNQNDPNLIFNDLKKHTIEDTKEHVIDNNLLSIKELHAFEENGKKERKNSFGFYKYLVLIIVSFLAIYFILNFSKDLIIFKYPALEPYIKYFYEIIEILKITTISLLGFINSKV